MIDRIRPTDGPAWQCLESATPAETSKIRCLCATVYEYYGDDDNALSSIAEIGATAEIELGRLVSVRFAGFDADALKGHVSAGVHLSYSRYRRHDYDGASGLLTLCEKAVEHLGEAPLTRVRLMYTRALVHRRLHEYNHAKRNLADAMSLADDVLARDPAKRALATLMLVQCTTAMSWLAYSEGALNVALTSLLSAKAMAFLLSAGETPNESPQCRLIVEFMSVLQACFERARGSKDRSVLDRVIKALRHSYATFEVAGHSDYRARAANQLALAYLSLADLTGGNSNEFHAALNEAERYNNEVRALVGNYDVRFRCFASINASRILRLRGRYEEAVAAASEAVQTASKREETFSRLGALVALGDCQLAFGKTREIDNESEATNMKREAIRTFTAALTEREANPKIDAICRLQLADANISLGNFEEARVQFREWQRLEDRVENASWRALGKRIEGDLKNLDKPFFISPSEDSLDADKLEKDLHLFLANWAKSKKGTDAAAARELKISRATLHNWLNKK